MSIQTQQHTILFGVKMITLSPVTVIIPSFNSSRTISRALHSVLKQTAPPKEIIIIDDASSKEERLKLDSILSSLDTPTIKVIYNDVNLGAGRSRDVGWEKASQPYIAFLDSDDSWHPEKLSIQLEAMKSNSNAALCATSVKVVETPSPPPHSPITNITPININRNRLLYKNFFSTPSVLIKSDLQLRFGTQRFSEDYLLWMRIAFDTDAELIHIPLPLTYCHKPLYGHSGLSANLLKMEKSELGNFKKLYLENKISFPQALFASFISIIKFLRRIITIRTSRSN